MTRAFTLIELLVVVTIIVVLLALLTPALDKAVYQAELAVCSGRLKGGATGVLQLFAIPIAYFVGATVYSSLLPCSFGRASLIWLAQMLIALVISIVVGLITVLVLLATQSAR